jgi:hypothetical protein
MIFMICESQVSLMPLSNCKITREKRKKEKKSRIHTEISIMTPPVLLERSRQD